MRILKDFEMCDGLSLNEKVKFRFPLRGLSSNYLSPTKLNVFNKFSVRYFVRVKIMLRRQAKSKIDEDGDLEEQNENQESNDEDQAVAQIIGAEQEVTLFQ